MSNNTIANVHEGHQHFAVEYNNIGWTLAAQPESAGRNALLLDAAHCSRAHWREVGTELQRMRAHLLVAHAHACCSIAETSILWARECTAYFTSTKTEDWELAFVHMIHAHAAYLSRLSKEHAEHYQCAKGIIAGMPDGEDKQIVLETWATIPTA